MKRVMKKNAQQTMGLPFSLIFSIMLIVVFIVVAFVGIKMFLNFNESAKLGLFYDDLQKEVDAVWQSSKTETTFKPILPSGITHVCFANLSATITNQEAYNEIIYQDFEHNTFLLPQSKAGNLQSNNIEHLNLSQITKIKNPYCIEATRSLILKKGFYDKFVIIE